MTHAPPMSIWVAGDPVPAAARRRGSFADMIRATTAVAWPGPWSAIDAVGGRGALPDPAAVAGVIVTGSPARIADQSPWMLRLQDGLRRLVDERVPVLGICFGHQLLGMALGGRSGPNPLGREIGTVTVSVHGEDVLLGDAPRTFVAAVTHLDAVLELPAGARPLASTDLDRYAAIRFREHAWGVQFHPEMDAEIVGDYIASARHALLAEGIDPDALTTGRRDTPDAAQVLRRFARHVARRAEER